MSERYQVITIPHNEVDAALTDAEVLVKVLNTLPEDHRPISIHWGDDNEAHLCQLVVDTKPSILDRGDAQGVSLALRSYLGNNGFPT